MVKKYIIMCGGNYSTYFEKPRQLSVVNGEVLVERTIRLLRENGIKDISISTNYRDFDYIGVPILEHENSYRTEGTEVKGYWCDAFYPMDEPVCYVFGDVYFSEEAIKKIVETDTDDIEFFGSRPPFAENYHKNHEEPFALKVVNNKHLKEAIEKTKQWEDEGRFWRKPLMWELWTVIKDTPLQTGPGEFPAEYIVINDYTSDIDRKGDIKKIERMLGGRRMVKLESLEDFTLGKFNELKNIERKNPEKNEKGWVYSGDTFECDGNMENYLLGDNKYKRAFARVIEVIPEKPKVEPKVEEPMEKSKIEKPKKKVIVKKAKK